MAKDQDGEQIAKLQILQQLFIVPSAKQALHLMHMLKALDMEPTDVKAVLNQVLHDYLNQKPEVTESNRNFPNAKKR